jgi:hypothetical protein
MITDFHDPTIKVETATPAAREDIPLLDPATARRFAYLDQAGATAYLDRLPGPPRERRADDADRRPGSRRGQHRA